MALSIAEKAVPLNGKKILSLHFPMKKDLARESFRGAAKEVLECLEDGDVAFITLGDPTLYSTFFHLYSAVLDLAPDTKSEIIPGVSSITAASARAGRQLALSGDKVAILPATYIKAAATYINDFEAALRDFDTVVLMKVHSVMDEIKKALDKNGLLDKAVYVCRAGMEGEIVKSVPDVEQGDLDYFSTIIVRKK